VEGSCEQGNEPSGSIKRLGSSWVAVQLAVSQEGLRSVKYVSKTRSILFLVLPRSHSPVSILPQQLSASELDSRLCTLHRPHGNHSLYCWQSLFTAPLHSNRRPIVSRVCFCENMFSKPLPSNGHGADHIQNNSFNTFSIVVCAYFGRCLEMGLHITLTQIFHTFTTYAIIYFNRNMAKT
jgi:hypothetical protein